MFSRLGILPISRVASAILLRDTIAEYCYCPTDRFFGLAIPGGITKSNAQYLCSLEVSLKVLRNAFSNTSRDSKYGAILSINGGVAMSNT